MGQLAEASVAKLRVERDETLRRLLSISEAECRLPATWSGTNRHVNFLLRMFASHQMDHIQHLHKLLRDRQHALTEPQLLLMKAHALQGEIEVLALSLTDDEFSKTGPGADDWSAQQLIEHVAEVERTYRQEVVRAVEQGRAQVAAG
ncbi:MAG: hypothetical protein GEU73_13510 [Chloroflexi bacterium]|nr:hypothetical protein [Chloroflexota bacterium]